MNADRVIELASKSHDELALLAAAWEQDAKKDAKRIGYLHHLIDGVGDLDVHEQACIYASALGREEPNEADYLAACRDMIDAAMKETTT